MRRARARWRRVALAPLAAPPPRPRPSASSRSRRSPPTRSPSSASPRSRSARRSAATTTSAPKLKGVKRLPLSHPNGPNLEQLAALDPDLVLSAPTWAKGNRRCRGSASPVAELDPRSSPASGATTRRSASSSAAGRGGAARAIATQAAVAARRRDPQAPAGDADPRRRAHPVRVPAEQLGRRHRQQRRRRAADRRASAPSAGFERISDEVVVAENPDIIIAVPHGNADDIPRLADYLRDNPAWSEHEGGAQRAASTSRPTTRCCSRGPTSRRTIGDVRTQVPEELSAVALRQATVARRRSARALAAAAVAR